MTMTPVQEAVGWSPHVLVEKFSDDQVGWARRHSGLLAPDGEVLRRLCGEPEDGIYETVGNLLTTAGVTRLANLLIGTGQAATATAARIGVGNSTTAAAVGQTDLQAAAGAANRQFKIMDATFPSTSAGVATFKASMATGEANFVWNEWGIDIGTPTVADGTTVNAVLLNRKVESMGTKVSGVWAITATVTFA